ncbi:MAG: alternative ribosome rescue aminoacyl-tRNA hydrolase ArfB [Hyphomicrobiales bacterium]
MPSPEPPPLPEEALDEKFLAATGPGGQNVNKVATAVQLRIDVYALRLPPAVFARLKSLAGNRWNADGSILLAARRFRTQEANRADARLRAAELVASAYVTPRTRVRTKPGKVAKARRVEDKTARGAIKRNRGRVALD